MVLPHSGLVPQPKLLETTTFHRRVHCPPINDDELVNQPATLSGWKRRPVWWFTSLGGPEPCAWFNLVGMNSEGFRVPL